MQDHSAAPISACYRCRRRKLRCSRERPACQRCTKFGSDCSYPAPPDRKLLAKTRRRAEIESQGESNSGSSHALVSSHVAVPDTSSAHTPNQTFATVGETTSALQTLLLDDKLSYTVDKLLVEVYFSYVFNSSLIVHRGQFEESHRLGQTPRHLRLAMYALASNFLLSGRVSSQDPSYIESLGDVSQIGRRWASTAAEGCLRGIDQATTSQIQTALILSLYWFSWGENGPASIFGAIAYRACRNILSNVDEDRVVDSTDQEMKRRWFWAAWLKNTLNSEVYVLGSSSDTLIRKVPLPKNEHGFLSPNENMMGLSAVFLHESPIDTQAVKGNAWLFALQVVQHWSCIRDYIEASERMASGDSLVRFQELADRLTEFQHLLKKLLPYSMSELLVPNPNNVDLMTIQTHVLFYYVRLVLHASVVPQLIGESNSPSISLKNMARSTAQVVIESARALSGLASHLLASSADLARLAPFTSQCMHVAALIHMTLLPSKDVNIQRAWKDLIPPSQIVKIMMPYWKLNEGMWMKMATVFDQQTKNTVTIGTQIGSNLPLPFTPNLKDSLLHSWLQYGTSIKQTEGRPSQAFEEFLLSYGTSQSVVGRTEETLNPGTLVDETGGIDGVALQETVNDVQLGDMDITSMDFSLDLDDWLTSIDLRDLF